MGHRHERDAEHDAARKLLRKTKHDYVLAELVGLVEASHARVREGAAEAPLSVPVVLTVGGVEVAGVLTSYVAWADASAAVDDPALSATLRELFGVGGADADLSLLTDVEPKERRQLHLLDASVAGGPPRPWRGRLSHVTGWSVGRPAR